MRKHVKAALVLFAIGFSTVDAFAAGGGSMPGASMTYRDHMPVGGGFREKKSTRYQQAQDLMKHGKYDAAIAVLQNILVDEPRNDAVWHDMGYASQMLTRYRDAVYYYERALSINPRRTNTRARLGESLLALGELPKAQEALDQLKQVCPSGCQEAQTLEAQINAYKADHPA